jgi:hypothetical protein
VGRESAALSIHRDTPIVSTIQIYTFAGIYVCTLRVVETLTFKESYMEPEIRAPAHAVLAAITVAACFGIASTANSAQTINFGQNLPDDSPVPAGYAGFNWGSAENDPQGGFGLTNFAAIIDQFSRNQPFDLNSVSFENYWSDGRDTEYTTVISGYRGNTLVKSATESYHYDSESTFAGLAFDDVNKITFSTTSVTTEFNCCDSHGLPTVTIGGSAPDLTLVSSLQVSNVAKAPELNGSSAATALTLLMGSLAVMLGRHPNNWRIRGTPRPT